MREYICAQCQQPFQSSKPTPNKKYCSRACLGGSKKRSIDIDRAVSLYKAGLSITKIAADLGHSYGPIQRALAGTECHLRRKGEHDNEIVALYSQGMSMSQIATHLGTTIPAVHSALRRKGAKPRMAKDYPQYDRSGPKNHRWKTGKRQVANGYIKTLAPGHPRENGGYVFEHIVVMESHLGRYLVWHGTGNPDNEVVHHINHDRQDNRIENLQLMTSKEHCHHHVRIRKNSHVRRVAVDIPLGLYEELKDVITAKGDSATSFILQWLKYGIRHTERKGRPYLLS